MIDDATRAEVRRLFFAEHWKIGTIAAQHGLHHGTVKAALGLVDPPKTKGTSRPTKIDAYVPFIRDTLQALDVVVDRVGTKAQSGGDLLLAHALPKCLQDLLQPRRQTGSSATQGNKGAVPRQGTNLASHQFQEPDFPGGEIPVSCLPPEVHHQHPGVPYRASAQDRVVQAESLEKHAVGVAGVPIPHVDQLGARPDGCAVPDLSPGDEGRVPGRHLPGPELLENRQHLVHVGPVKKEPVTWRCLSLSRGQTRTALDKG